MLDKAIINKLRKKNIEPQKLFIHGKWQAAQSGKTSDNHSPIDGKIITTLAEADHIDVELAVRSARETFSSGVWANAAPSERKKIMLKIAELIEENAVELAILGVRDNGTEIGMAIKAEPGSAAGTFRYYGEAIDKSYGEIAPTNKNILGLIHKEPVGVVAAIVPWNFPLMIGAWKIAPALAAGNSVVLKPSESASLSLLKLAELCSIAGLPDGVFNVITGKGAICGSALALNMDVDILAFTGSGFIGRKLLEYSAKSNLKRIYLELGGKSPNIVFADSTNLDQVAKVSANGIFRNSGQVCVAGSRLIVQENIHEELLEKIIAHANAIKIGDPLDLDTDVGAIANEAQLKTNLSFIEKARNEGANCVAGGHQILQETGGYYVEPTIFDNVTNEMTLANEEVFGPVLAVTKFKDEADAIAIANQTEFGLASAVWTSNLSTAHRMVRAINAGVVHVNCYGGADLTVPLGGVKQSGNGSDKSLHAFDKYVNLKTAWIQL